MLNRPVDYPFEVHPVFDGPSLVDLARVMSRAVGSSVVFPESKEQDRIKGLVGNPEKILLILVDGLGSHFLSSPDSPSFLCESMSMSINTVFPSTTASALTSLSTGLWPSQHGALGWWTYLKQINGPVTTLPFTRMLDGISLEELGVAGECLFNAEPYLRTSDREVSGLLPHDIYASVFSSYALGGNPVFKYWSMEEGFQSATNLLKSKESPTFMYFYIPDVDSNAHRYGIDHNFTKAAVTEVDRLCRILRDEVGGSNIRVIITADHGHLEASEYEKIAINEKVLEAGLIQQPVSGDARVSYMRFDQESADVTHAALAGFFGDEFGLITSQEAIRWQLFGPIMNEISKDRLGDLIAISKGSSIACWSEEGQSGGMLDLKSVHSGLTKLEMEVPLIIF
tara:strand:- start:1762 stop:2952 length:1191 start_codon:yes stop_codon:yes gene_type:complete